MTNAKVMARIEQGPRKDDLVRVAENDSDAMERIAQESPAWNAMLRTTCVATQIDGGHAKNALPQLASANVNCRVLPEDSVDYVQSALQKIITDDQVRIAVDGRVRRGPNSPMRDDVFNEVSRLTEKLWPGVPAVPIMVMGATDGLYLREAGIPTYGVQGIFMDRDDIRFHGRDERLGVAAFYEGQDFLYHLVQALAKPTSN